MAWPIDARYRTMTAGTVALAADQNEIQDAIVDLYRKRWKNLAFGVYNSAADVAWVKSYSSGAWLCLSGTDPATIPIEIETTGILYQVQVKAYRLSDTGLTIKLYNQDANWSTAGTAPTSSLVGTLTAAGSTAPDYTTYLLDKTATPVTLTEDISHYLQISSADAGDAIVAVRIQYVPINIT